MYLYLIILIMSNNFLINSFYIQVKWDVPKKYQRF